MNKRQQFQSLLNKETSESLGGSQKNALLEPYTADSDEARLGEQTVIEMKHVSESGMEQQTRATPPSEQDRELELDKSQETIPETETFTEQQSEPKTETATSTTIDPFAGLREKRKKREELSTRSTFMIDNDLLARLTRISRGRGKGFKYQFVNAALRMALDMFEQND